MPGRLDTCKGCEWATCPFAPDYRPDCLERYRTRAEQRAGAGVLMCATLTGMNVDQACRIYNAGMLEKLRERRAKAQR